MANVAHSSLTGSNLHENKGVSAASDNTVATATTGATVWQKLTASHLTGTGKSFGGQLFHCRYQATSGTGSAASVLNTRTVVPIATSVTNEIGSASISTNTLTLPAGTYYAKAVATVAEGDAKLRIRNTTDGTTLVVGMNSEGDGTFTTPVFCEGRFTLASSKSVELHYYTDNAKASNGFGGAQSTGEIEIFAEIYIWKIV